MTTANIDAVMPIAKWKHHIRSHLLTVLPRFRIAYLFLASFILFYAVGKSTRIHEYENLARKYSWIHWILWRAMRSGADSNKASSRQDVLSG